MSWEIVTLLFVYPLFACGLAVAAGTIVYKTKMFEESQRQREREAAASHEHQLRVLEMQREDKELEAKRAEEAEQRAAERKTAMAEDLLRQQMGYKTPQSTVSTEHPAGPVPITPADAEVERAWRTSRRLAEVEEVG